MKVIKLNTKVIHTTMKCRLESDAYSGITTVQAEVECYITCLYSNT